MPTAVSEADLLAGTFPDYSDHGDGKNGECDKCQQDMTVLDGHRSCKRYEIFALQIQKVNVEHRTRLNVTTCLRISMAPVRIAVIFSSQSSGTLT